jgi:ribosome-associated protein
MKNLPIKSGIIIPEHELEITASRSSGAGGQHVNKTDSKISIRWNVKNSAALADYQKERILNNLASRITTDGDIIIHASSSRSQAQNKKSALDQLSHLIRKALYVAKKRIATKASQGTTELRLRTKAARSTIKKNRQKKIDYE